MWNRVAELTAENLRLLAEIDKWKDASGLEIAGDPDGITPEAVKEYWECFERINTSPVLFWSFAEVTDDHEWHSIECRPEHPLCPLIRVVRMQDQAHGAQVLITCNGGDRDKEFIIADVIVPFRDTLAACSVCEGKGYCVIGGDTETECPWCLGDKKSAMDEAKEIACGIYWSWIRSPNGGGEKGVDGCTRRLRHG